MEPPDAVLNWLDNLSLADDEVIDGRPGSPPRNRSGDPEEPPGTPNRPALAPATEEISPTSTQFTDVFDRPEKQWDQESSISDVTTVTESGGEMDNKTGRDDVSGEKKVSTVAVRRPLSALLGLEQKAEAVEDDSNNADDDKTTSTIPPPQPSVPSTPASPSIKSPLATADTPHPSDKATVLLTSCYQCLLAQLPCSRTLPSCTRCIHNGCSHLCLLHRRKLFREMVAGDTEENQIPVLLVLKAEEEEMVREKVGLLRELHEKWLQQEERRNWVLPRDIGAGLAGKWDKYQKREERRHPGWGVGRKVFVEVELGEVVEGV
ncbi:hypothetical protein M011DRAFT_474714 [Sporormia fimetaria CBS 119925]|uniref:Uncharacterized protein n=1 Tax=Sporormia fimetaria CBS 119925 TaxID=1340428 RepID=A0A6A6VM08_9PLEO|nr:hypothetical protein M011DRAFT_474714 [Sporormia fimetaria CBS 119925]